MSLGFCTYFIIIKFVSNVYTETDIHNMLLQDNVRDWDEEHFSWTKDCLESDDVYPLICLSSIEYEVRTDELTNWLSGCFLRRP
jgi:hypothetical protein